MSEKTCNILPGWTRGLDELAAAFVAFWMLLVVAGLTEKTQITKFVVTPVLIEVMNLKKAIGLSAILTDHGAVGLNECSIAIRSVSVESVILTGWTETRKMGTPAYLSAERPEWGIGRVVNGPPMSQPLAEGAPMAMGNIEKSGPFGTALYGTLILNPNVVPSIPRLSLGKHPLAVDLGVGSVVVNPVKSHPMRSVAHIRKEVLEVEPRRFNGNAASTVVCITRAIGIKATPFHVQPDVNNRVERCLGVSVRSRTLSLPTSATFRSSTSEIRVLVYALISAVTSALPECDSTLRDTLKGNQPAKPHPYQFYFAAHVCSPCDDLPAVVYMFVCHLSSRQSTVVQRNGVAA